MAIRWEKLTVKAQEAVQAASTMAAEHGNPEILPLHLLAALLEDREGICVPVLEHWLFERLARQEVSLPKPSGFWLAT